MLEDPALVGTLAPLHPISRKHLAVLGGELGIFQHARRSAPDPAHGHCVDDVARARIRAWAAAMRK